MWSAGIEFIEIDVVRIANANLDGTNNEAIRTLNLEDRNGIALFHDVVIV